MIVTPLPLIVLILCTIANTQDLHLSKWQDPFNVVWFIVQPFNNGSTNTDVEYPDLSFCRLVSACSASDEGSVPIEIVEATAPNEHQVGERKIKKNDAYDCDKIFTDSITDLLETATNLGMSTVNVLISSHESMESHSPFKKSFEPHSYHTFKPYSKKLLHNFSRKRQPASLENVPFETYSRSLIMYPRIEPDRNILDLPVFNIFPPEPKIVFNTFDRYKRKPNSSRIWLRRLMDTNADNGTDNVSRTIQPNLNDDDLESNDLKGTDTKTVLTPGELENYHSGLQDHINSCSKCKTRTGGNIWELLKIMGDMDNSMFRHFDSHKHCDDHYDVSKMDMLDLSQRTITQMESMNNPHGYLCVFRGGKLEELQDPLSLIYRSIHYAQVLTNSSQTLLMLSMSCPDDVLEMRNCHSATLPIYCRGPHCKDLEEAEYLKDISRVIKQRLLEVNVNGTESNTFRDDIPQNYTHEKRIPRSVSEIVDYDRKLNFPNNVNVSAMNRIPRYYLEGKGVLEPIENVAVVIRVYWFSVFIFSFILYLV